MSPSEYGLPYIDRGENESRTCHLREFAIECANLDLPKRYKLNLMYISSIHGTSAKFNLTLECGSKKKKYSVMDKEDISKAIYKFAKKLKKAVK